MAVDILIRGGMVYDGIGAFPVWRDVLVKDGRIEALVRPGEPVDATRVIDAERMAVAPGFIDIHTHSDVSVLLDGRAQSKIYQGVTTEVTGNCGFSPFPFTNSHHGNHLDLLAGIGDDPIEPTWTGLAGYGDAVANRGTAVNIAPLVGHGQLRIAAQGMAQDVSADGLATMKSQLVELIDQGAYGLSTGLTYVPSRYAETAELEALCSVLSEHDALYATHSRGSGFAAAPETAELGHISGARIQYSHIAINQPARWGSASRLLEVFEGARRDGVDIACDVYPYDASASALTQYLPPWVQEGGVEAMSRRLADPIVMRLAEQELAAGWGEGDPNPWYWDRVILARTDDVLDAPEGATIEQAAAIAGMSEARYVLELCRVGGNRVQVVLFYRTEDDMRTFLRYEHAVIGSDGSAIPFEQYGRLPHPRAFGAHARVLGRYTRELGDLDLATAVRKMTGAVADRVGITDRGTLRPAQAADVVVFDPGTVADHATFGDPCQAPSGIGHVVVNGVIVVDDSVQTPARPGKVLRSR